jgi:MFS family permease
LNPPNAHHAEVAGDVNGAVRVGAIAATWPLLLGMCVLMLGAGLQGTLLGLRATLEGFLTPVTGAIMSCYYVGYLAGTAAAPRMLRQIGHIRVFAALAAIASATILVQAAFVQPLIWALMRLLSGVCFAGIYVVAESWLNDRASQANRGRLLAIYMLVLYVGLGAAQFLIILAKPSTATPFMLVSVLISLSMVPIVVSATHAPQLAATIPRKVRYRDLYRDSPLGVVAVSVSGLVSSILFAMGPVYARLSGLGDKGVATFMAVSILSAVPTQYPVGRLSDRMDRRTVIAAVCTVATIVAGSLVAFPHMPRLLFLLLTALFSGSALTLYSLAVSHVNDKLEPTQMVAASSALLRLNGGAAAIGPLLAGSLIAGFGPAAYFTSLGAMTGGLLVYDLWRKARRQPVPPEQKGPFISAQPQAMSGEIVSSVTAAKPVRHPSETSAEKSELEH